MRVFEKVMLFCVWTIIFSALGCSTDKSELMKYWSDLQPWSGEDRFYPAMERVEQYLESRANRLEAISFVRARLKEKQISFKDQFRLATIVRQLQDHAQKEEVHEVYALIGEGRAHIDYYGLVLRPIPGYITACFDVFTNSEPLVAHCFNPDGGAKTSFSIQNDTLQWLREATGQKFDADYADWQAWWEREGKHLKFDYANKRFITGKMSRDR